MLNPDRAVEGQQLERASTIFARAGEQQAAGLDVKALHAKIGQQALEIDFLSDTLGREK